MSIRNKAIIGSMVGAFALTGAGLAIANDHKDGDRDGRRGFKGPRAAIGMLCSEDAAIRQTAMAAATQAVITMDAEQQAKFDAYVDAASAARTNASGFCDSVNALKEGGERPSATQRQELRSQGRGLLEPVGEARAEFRDSLSDEQKATLRKIMPRKGHHGHGKRGGRDGRGKRGDRG